MKIFDQHAKIGVFTNRGLEINYAVMAKARRANPKLLKKALRKYIRENIEATEATLRFREFLKWKRAQRVKKYGKKKRKK